MNANVPKIPDQPLPRDLVKEIAMDIGKAVADHIKRMYPDAVGAASSTFLLSVRNCTFNEIMAALSVNEESAIARRLEERKKHRRELTRLRKLGERAAAAREAEG